MSMHRIEGDFLGAESCIDLRADMEDIRQGGGGVRRKKRVQVVKKEYPPPLPWLVRTESLRTTQMPWVMKRSYTEDGRLIITEETSERYQYFRVDRSDQRLRMDLVQIQVRPFWSQEQEPPDAAASDETPGEFVPEESLLGVHADYAEGSGSAAAEGGSETTAATLVEPAAPDVSVGSEDDGGSGGGNKCSGSLVFGVAAVPALHPVRT